MTKADLAVIGARIWDGADRGDEAVAVADGRIIATGTNRSILQLAGDETEIIDAGGRRLIPGLIDSHLHLVRAGRTWNDEVRWDDVKTGDDALTALRERAAAVGPGRWVGVMGGWHPNQFRGKAPRPEDLDRALPKNPVFVQRAYAETLINAKAREEMGWGDEDAPDRRVTSPPAMAQLRTRLGVSDVTEAMSGTRSLLRELNRLGVTGAIDASGFGITADSYDAFLRLFAEGERGFRTRFLLGAANPGKERADLERWTETVTLHGDDDYVRYLGAGEVLDYAAHDMEGLTPKDITARVGGLREMSRFLADRGWPIHLHSILDTSIDTVLEAWESLGDVDISGLRWAICHADQIGAKNLGRVRDLGVGITIQNGMSMRGIDCDSTWGTERVTQAPPIRTMIDLGIPVAAGTDGTVACAYNPWRCIAWMITGQSVDGAPPRVSSERLDRDQALRLYTSVGAWFSFEEDTRGTLQPGAHADFAVLSADPLTVAESAIANIESVMTVVAGKQV
ncbi:MAG TPA: amidohydrolase [Acidimicrobiia bacterium]|nr:amidohydrolase [Acidimicrobiia bacterium]